MSAFAHLLSDIDGRIGRDSADGRVQALSRITDLLVHDAALLGPEQIVVFDEVIQRFASAIETRARAELAERLAGLSKGPPNVLRSLARDEIVVARPILSRSPILDDQDLVAVALEKGRDHMLAICERPAITPAVTDILVSEGDGVVRHAVAGNLGARFSPSGTATLIDLSRREVALQDILGARPDLSPAQTRQLVAIAKETARRRLASAVPGSRGDIAAAVERGASDVELALGAPRADFGPALAAISDLRDTGALSESHLLDFATAGRRDEAICALAALTGLSVAAVERVFAERDNDLLIVMARAKGWSWRTLRELLRLRNPLLSERHQFRRAEDTFDGLATPTAQRVLHFLKLREASGPAPGELRPSWLRDA